MTQRRRSVFTGCGSCIPPTRVANDEFLGRRFFMGYGEPIDQADNSVVVAKFEAITGIAERRYADSDVLTSDLATTAARAALDDARVDPESLDYVIVAHNFGDVCPGTGRVDLLPTLAARVKQRLCIRNPSCIAYDLPFGCAGWLQAVIQAHAFLAVGEARRALIVGADTLSRVLDPHDRDSMIFADGAGAVVLESVEADEPMGILGHATRSDTLEEAHFLRMDRSYDPEDPEDRRFLKMDGRKVYEYALQQVPEAVRGCLDRSGVRLGEVSKVLLHQANAKLDHAIVKRLYRLAGEGEPPPDVMPMTISWLGNSSVATLPTMFDLVRRGCMEGHRFSPGDLLVFAAVGAGMNINTVVYRYP